MFILFYDSVCALSLRKRLVENVQTTSQRLVFRIRKKEKSFTLTKRANKKCNYDAEYRWWFRVVAAFVPYFFLFFVHYCALTVLRCISIGSRIVCLRTISFQFSSIEYIYIWIVFENIYIMPHNSFLRAWFQSSYRNTTKKHSFEFTSFKLKRNFERAKR